MTTASVLKRCSNKKNANWERENFTKEMRRNEGFYYWKASNNGADIMHVQSTKEDNFCRIFWEIKNLENSFWTKVGILLK